MSGLRKKIADLRKAPYQVRVKVMWFGVGIIALLVIILWAATLKYRSLGRESNHGNLPKLFENIKEFMNR